MTPAKIAMHVTARFLDVLRRSSPIGAALLAAGTLTLGAAATAADPAYPVRPIRVIVPQASGGTADLLARMLGERMEATLGAGFVVDDRPGASGITGSDVARRAPADGYTLLMASTATHAMTPHVVANLPYDPVQDFVPVINLVHQTKVVLASPSLGVATLGQLVAVVQSRPGQLNFASTGIGSSSHLDVAQLMALTDMDLVHIPYRGSAQAVAALVANEVQVLLASVTAAQPAIASGRARALAVVADQRSPLLPDVPTIVEAGLPRLDAQTWIGFLAPAGTPRWMIDKLNVALNRVLRSPDTRAWLERQGLEAVGGSPEALDSELRSDIDKWGKVARRLGIRPQ